MVQELSKQEYTFGENCSLFTSDESGWNVEAFVTFLNFTPQSFNDEIHCKFKYIEKKSTW